MQFCPFLYSCLLAESQLQNFGTTQNLKQIEGLMAFRFPFPTLRNLSMLRIGQAVLQKKAVLQRTRAMLNQFDEIDVQYLVPSLVQIHELRHDLANVIDGMLKQTRPLLSVMQWATTARDVVLIFDVHGRLDVAAVWKCYFEVQLDNVESMDPAMDLLKLALREQIWCVIEAIIAKILSLVGLDLHSLPKPKMIRKEPDGYELVYSLGDLLSEPSSANVVSRLQRISRRYNIHISRRRNCFCIPIFDFNFDRSNKYVYLREFIITTETSEKVSFIEQVIPYEVVSFDPVSRSTIPLEIITDLDDVMLRQFMINVSEDHVDSAEFVCCILCDMLHWPYSQFFMPMLELLAHFMNTDRYAELFCYIAEKVPGQYGFGNLHSNLLLRFCLAIPLDVKQEHLQGSELGELFTETWESLRHDNSKLHNRIVKILSPQVQ